MLEIELLVRYKLFLLFTFSITIFGQTHPNSRIDSLLNVGIEKIVTQEYTKANQIFSKLDSSYNKNPLGEIYLAANEIARAVDYEEDLSKEIIDSLLAGAKAKAERLLEIDADNLWYNYYLALIFGYQAYYQAISGNIISGFGDGVLSLRSFHKCLEIDVDFYEAYIALGSYNYWKSAQTKSLLWLPFVQDNRDKGIEYLERALHKSSYNKYLAAYSLIWIYIDYDESDKAVDLSLEMLEQYKNSRFFMWGLARAYQDVDKKKAIAVYWNLLHSVETNPKRNQFNDIVVRHKLAMLYNQVGEYEESLKLCDEILDFDFKSTKIKNRLSERIQRALKLKNKLEEILIKQAQE